MPLILVQELDKGRGGASLEELQAECPDDCNAAKGRGAYETWEVRELLHTHTNALAHAHTRPQ